MSPFFFSICSFPFFLFSFLLPPSQFPFLYSFLSFLLSPSYPFFSLVSFNACILLFPSFLALLLLFHFLLPSFFPLPLCAFVYFYINLIKPIPFSLLKIFTDFLLSFLEGDPLYHPAPNINTRFFKCYIRLYRVIQSQSSRG